MFSFSSIFADTKNFISNNIGAILIYFICYAVVIQVIFLFLLPDMSSTKEFELMIQQVMSQYGDVSQSSITQMANNLTPQEIELVRTATFSVFINLLLQLIATILSTSVVISIIFNVAHNTLSINNFISHIGRVIMPIILFILLGIAMGLVIFIIIAIIMPLGLMLGLVATVFYQIMFVIFSAIIVEPNSSSNFKGKIAISFHLFRREIRNVIPMIAIYFALIFGLNYIIGSFYDDNFVILVIINLMSLLINLFAICYFYRLYTLSNNQLPYDPRN